MPLFLVVFIVVWQCFYFVLERQTCVSCSKVSDPVQCSHSVVCDINEVINDTIPRF